ncbi:MAG: Gfo/Idh/MocA family protein, partial [Candidatus Thorarchaeota archaeon]
KDVEISTLIDTSRKRAKRLGKKFGIENILDDYTKALDRANIDFACITVPPLYHTEIAVDFMKAGKHVLIEKPMATTTGESKAILETSKSAGVLAGVVHNRRFFPIIQQVKKAVEYGKLGDVYQADFVSMVSGPSVGYPGADWHFDQKVSGGGVIMDQGTHTVDLIRYLLGDIRNVFAMNSDVLKNLDVDVAATALLQTELGANCTLELSWLNDFTLCPISLWGTSGSIFAEPMFGYYEEIHGPRNPVRRWINITQTLIRFAHQFVQQQASPSHHALLSNFIASIRSGRKPLVTAKDGLKSIEAVDGLYRSAKQGIKVTI